MYTISEEVLRSILKKKFASLVGKSCKRIEVIRDTPNIDFKTKLDLCRSLVKELNYETMREIEETISAFSDGLHVQVDFKSPDPR